MKDAELAILSIIAEAPITGYDLKAVIDERNMRLWTLVGVESLYYVIEKLENQGLIVSIDEKPPQQVKHRLYRVTPAGIGVLQTAITDLLSSPQPLPRGLELGLANLPVLKTDQAHHALLGYRASLHTRYEAAQRQLAFLHENDAPFHIISMFEHRIAILQAEMTWFDGWIDSWKEQAPPVEDSPPTRPIEDAPRMQQLILPQDEDSFHKHATRKHHPNDIEFPPPPEKRKTRAADATRVNSPTPPGIERQSDNDDLS